MDSYRYAELEGLQVDLRANIGDLSDRDTAKLDRRSRSEPSHGILEDQDIGLRIARRRVEGLCAVAEQGEDRILLGWWQDCIGRGRLERDPAYEDRQHRLSLHCK